MRLIVILMRVTMILTAMMGKKGRGDQIRSYNLIDIIEQGNAIELYSPPTSLGLLYLCKVIDFGELNAL